MTKLPCGCDEKEVIIGNIKGAIDYYEKDIEWVGLAQKRLNKVIDEALRLIEIQNNTPTVLTDLQSEYY